MLRIGYHISVAGSLDLAYDRASAIGCTAMQIFVSNPRGWEVKVPAKPIVDQFVKKEKDDDISTVCHMPYLPNLASTNSETQKRSVASMKETIGICNSLRIKYLITHLGSHLGKGKEVGLQSVIEALDKVSGSLGEVTILLENQAGHANSIGAEVEDLRFIYDNSPLAKKGKLGFCLDTCHTFAAGYDIRKDEALDKIDDILGFDKIHAVHMNDAMFDLGSGKDRHDNIGRGFIGIKGFKNILGYKDISKKIIILETPPNPEIREGEEMEELRKLVA